MERLAMPQTYTHRIGVTSGMRGWFAVLCDDDGPLQSGIGSYSSAIEAWQEACEWAEAEGLPPPHPLEADGRAVRSDAPRGRTRAYAGIGSRETPEEYLALMRRIAQALAERGYVLRSGAAQGADTAFEQGARSVGGSAEIFVPWRGFDDRVPDDPMVVIASALPHAPAAEALASQFHPAWSRLSPGARRLHARNTHQVLGARLDDPVAFVVCWAPSPVLEGERVVNVKGGTGLAVRLAASRGIPVFHLGIEVHRSRIERWLDPASSPQSSR
jgi:hypothetical protein